MFGFIKGVKDMAAMSNSFDIVHQKIQELLPQVEQAYNKSQFNEAFIVLAYMCRVGICDRLERQNWPLTTGVYVPSISRNNVTIFVALSKTESVVRAAGLMLGIQQDIDDVMNKRKLFYELEKHIPLDIKKKLGG
jgi:hypothetical protein